MSDFASAELIAEQLVPVAGYALQPLPSAFKNLDVIVPLLDENSYDVTAFYSRRRTGLAEDEIEELCECNQRAYDLAKEAGGLVLYYQGVLLEQAEEVTDTALDLDFAPDCLSFCIWRSLAQAKSGSALSEHRAAARRANEWYEHFAIKKYTAITREQKLTLEEAKYQA